MDVTLAPTLDAVEDTIGALGRNVGAGKEEEGLGGRVDRPLHSAYPSQIRTSPIKAYGSSLYHSLLTLQIVIHIYGYLWFG
jgi:hypothetical protein